MADLIKQTIIPASAVCDRYMISPRTLSRWTQRKTFPAPIRINGRRFFAITELETWDRMQLAARNEEGA